MAKGIEALKKAVKTPKLLLGARRALAAMKAGQLEAIYVAQNAPKIIQEDIEHFSKFVEVEVVHLPIQSDEFGIVCKRQHTVAVAGLLK